MKHVDVIYNEGQLYNDNPLSLEDLQNIADGVFSTAVFCECRLYMGEVIGAVININTLTITASVLDTVDYIESQVTIGDFIGNSTIVSFPPHPIGVST